MQMRDTERLLREQIERLEQSLREMREFALVSHNGDPWYAENEDIDVPGVLERTREALGEPTVD